MAQEEQLRQIRQRLAAVHGGLVGCPQGTDGTKELESLVGDLERLSEAIGLVFRLQGVVRKLAPAVSFNSKTNLLEQCVRTCLLIRNEYVLIGFRWLVLNNLPKTPRWE